MNKYRKVQIGEVCRIEKGLTGIASAIPGEYPLVTTAMERKSCNTFQFDTDAVCIPLVSSTGHGKKSLNYIHYQSGKFALGSILAAVIPEDKKQLSAAFLHRYLQFYKDRKIVPLMKGAANVSLAVKDIASIEIPLPPVDEQNEFIELFNKLNILNEELQNQFAAQSSYISLLRQSILQEAIEGKLTAGWRKKNNPVKPGDPETDATALLEKIKEEKCKLIAEGKIRKEKPLAPIKPDEVPFELPEGWVWARLGEVCSKIGSGSTPKGSNYVSKGIPFFRSQNIHNVCLVYDDIKYISKETHRQMNGTIVYPDDLLLNITGGSLGRCSLVPNDFFEGNVSQHVCIIRPIFSCPKYFHHLFLSPVFQKFVFNSTTGAGREGLPKYNLELFVIPMPPLAEQHVIVERVDRLHVIVDDLEKRISERKLQASELMQAVLREAFESPKSATIEQKSPVSIEQISSAPSTLEQELTNFQKIQILGSVIEIIAEQRQAQGEMILAKYLYLLHHIYKINAGFQFKKWHFGPYDPEIKKVSNNRGYFRKTGKTGYETISVLNKERLFKYENRLVTQIRENLPELVSIFGKYKNPEERSHKIELLASVLKVIEDTGKSDLESVYDEFARWMTDEKKTGFTSKAEKFSEEEVEKVLGFIRKQKWA